MLSNPQRPILSDSVCLRDVPLSVHQSKTTAQLTLMHTCMHVTETHSLFTGYYQDENLREKYLIYVPVITPHLAL